MVLDAKLPRPPSAAAAVRFEMLRLSLSLTPKQLRAARPLAYGVLLALTITMIGRISATSWRTTHSAGWTPAQLALMATAVLSYTVGMEYYARYAHRDLWHGDALWKIHTTHHGQRNKGPFEHNDVFGVANVLVILPIMHWAQLVERSLGSAAVLGFTIGVSAFGTAYMVVHDGVVHSRFPTFGLERRGLDPGGGGGAPRAPQGQDGRALRPLPRPARAARGRARRAARPDAGRSQGGVARVDDRGCGRAVRRRVSFVFM